MTDHNTATQERQGLTITVWPSVGTPEQGSHVDCPWDALPELLAALPRGEVFGCASFRGYRDDRHHEQSTAIVLDHDGGTIALLEAVNALEGSYDAYLFETSSSTPEHPRWRAILRLAAPISAETYRKEAKRWCELLQCKPESAKPSQCWFGPNGKPDYAGEAKPVYRTHGAALAPEHVSDAPKATVIEPAKGTLSDEELYAKIGNDARLSAWIEGDWDNDAIKRDLPRNEHDQPQRYRVDLKIANRMVDLGAGDEQILELLFARGGLSHNVDGETQVRESHARETIRKARALQAKQEQERKEWEASQRRRKEGTGPFDWEYGDHVDIARALIAELGEPVATEGTFWTYAEASGLWLESDRHACRKLVADFQGTELPAKDGVRPLKLTDAAIDGAYRIAISMRNEKSFFSAERGVAFANGYLTLGNEELRPHARENRARHGFPFAYDPRAERAPLLAFLDSLFANCEPEERAKRIALLQEFAGACLFGLATTYQKCVLLMGPGGNGKSQLLTVLRAAVPDGTTESLAPQLWSKQFYMQRLLGMKLNAVDELPQAEIIATGAFKAAVTGEPQTFERKYVDSFKETLSAGHAFAGNALPATADLTEAYFDRFFIVPFGVKFRGTNSDKKAIGQWLVDHHRPGIVAWAIEGAERLVERGRYTESAASAAAIAEWRRTADTVQLFVSEKCEREGQTPAQPLYEAYRTWCRDLNFNACNWINFSRRMKSAGLAPMAKAKANVYPVSLRQDERLFAAPMKDGPQ